MSTWLTPVVGFTYTKVPIGLTTLCDGYPRASSASYINEYYTKWINTTYTFSTTFFHSTVPGITASGYEVHRPACTLAPNDNPMCDRVASAYQWWASSEAQASRTPSPEHPGALAKPSCWQLIRPDPQARPTCLFNHYSQEIYYWPTPTPTGTDFCNSSWVGPTAAPTIPGKPNTAVVSGYTLTSPSVYHFLHGVNISTYAGKKSRIDGSYVPRTNVFLPAITPSPLRPYVYSELESDMLTAWGTRKRKETYSKYTVAKDFRLLDVHTIRADKWYGNSSSRRNSTIFQNEANPLLAIPLSEFMEQNDLGHGLTDCKWVSGTRVQSSATYIIDSVSLSSFYEITASEVVVPITTEPAPGPTASSSPLVTTVR